MAKKIPVTAQMDELMETRMDILNEQNEIEETIVNKTQQERQKINEIEKIIAKKIKQEKQKITTLGNKLGELDEQIEEIMTSNKIKEYPHKYAYIKYVGTRSIDINKAKAILKPDVFKAVVKQSITVGSVEKFLSPIKLQKIVTEKNFKVKFGKPKDKIKEVTFKDGVKQVIRH